MGKSLKALGRQEEAARAFLQAMQNQPGYTKAMSERADSLIETGDFVSAGDLLQKSVAAHPDDVDLKFTRGRLMLWQRDWKAAIEAFDAAFKGIALCEADQDMGAAAVDGLDRLVDVPVFSQMFPQSLNDGLIDAVTTHPSLFWERPNNSTIGGGQTGNLVNDPGDVVARFVGALKSCVDSIVRGMAKDPSHLFARSIPKSWRYSIWATVLSQGGHQTPHLHPGGWLSGVYYVEVPETISIDENRDNEGWIEFGAPGYGYEPVRDPPVKRIQPIPGRLTVFPSSVFHRTLPFRGDGRRISIAFDLIPTSW